MFGLSVIIFATAMLGGLLMAVIHFRSKGEKRPPMPIAIGHGVLAAAAVVLLIVALANARHGFAAGLSSLGVIALILFVVAALGGSFVFVKHVRRKPLPGSVLAIHALVGMAAFALLLMFLIFQQPGVSD